MPIFVIPSGIIVFLQPCINLFVDVSIIALQLLRESYVVLLLSTVIDVRPSQPRKGWSLIDVTLYGMLIYIKPQPLKAPSPIVVTPLGIVIDVRLEQLKKAPVPIDVTLSGMFIDVIPEQNINAVLPMSATSPSNLIVPTPLLNV